jgi:septum formation protein
MDSEGRDGIQCSFGFCASRFRASIPPPWPPGGQRLIFLASASPRRGELLRQIGVAHEVRPVDIDESPVPGEKPAHYALRLAEAKARVLWGRLSAVERRPVLAADTTVALDDAILGKPTDRADAAAMLARLSGREHEVHTAVALLHEDGADSRLSTSRVAFRTLSAAEIDWYWNTGEPADKAGAYAVQGRAATFIRHLSGSYSGVMGLPLYETWELLAPVLGLNAWSSGA